MPTMTPAEALRDLRGLGTTPHQVISCYLRLGADERVRDRYRVELRTAAAAARDGLPESLSHDDRTTVLHDIEHLLEFAAAGEGLPPSAGVAIFACSPLGLFDVVPLPRVHHTRIVVAPAPSVGELVATEREFGRIVVAVADRGRARLFEVTAMDVTELAGIHPDTTRGGKFHGDRQDAPGWGERDYHGRIAEERHRRYALVTEALQALAAERPLRGIMLAGPSREVAALRHFLPEPLARRVLGTARLNPTSVSAAEVREAALAIAAAADRRRIAAQVARMHEAVGTGWAVNGIAPVLDTLAAGAVRTLFVRPGEPVTGFRCGDSDRLVLTRDACRGEGEPQPVADLVEAVLEEALLSQAEVVTVEDAVVAEGVDRVAAMLRFR